MRQWVVALLLAGFFHTALAAPAPWHLWHSILDGRRYCSQTAPGPGWTRVDGPFKDVRCKRRGNPGQTLAPEPAP